MKTVGEVTKNDSSKGILYLDSSTTIQNTLGFGVYEVATPLSS